MKYINFNLLGESKGHILFAEVTEVTGVFFKKHTIRKVYKDKRVTYWKYLDTARYTLEDKVEKLFEQYQMKKELESVNTGPK